MLAEKDSGFLPRAFVGVLASPNLSFDRLKPCLLGNEALSVAASFHGWIGAR